MNTLPVDICQLSPDSFNTHLNSFCFILAPDYVLFLSSALHCFICSYCSLFATRLSGYTSAYSLEVRYCSHLSWHRYRKMKMNHSVYFSVCYWRCGERLSNGRMSSRLSVPSIDSGSDVQPACCIPAIDRYLPLCRYTAWAQAAGTDRQLSVPELWLRPASSDVIRRGSTHSFATYYYLFRATLCPVNRPTEYIFFIFCAFV